VALTFRSRVAFAHECADPGRTNPGEQDRQENYRSCGSSRHFGKLYLRLSEMRKLGNGSPQLRIAQTPPSTLPHQAWKGLGFSLEKCHQLPDKWA